MGHGMDDSCTLAVSFVSDLMWREMCRQMPNALPKGSVNCAQLPQGSVLCQLFGKRDLTIFERFTLFSILLVFKM